MSEPICAVIVDDEPLARERLCRLLERERDITIVGEAGDGDEAVRLIRRTAPELAFLDIRLPGFDAFEVLSRLGDRRPPAVVFVTAFATFAARAFQRDAVDYLLKPLDQARLECALRRARLRIHSARPRPTPGVEGNPRQAGRLAVRTGGKIVLLSTSDIVWVAASNHHCRVHLAGASLLVDEALATLSARLPADQFVRLNRSEWVNRDCVLEVRPKSHGDCHVLLSSGTQRTLSRTRRVEVLSRLGHTT